MSLAPLDGPGFPQEFKKRAPERAVARGVGGK